MEIISVANLKKEFDGLGVLKGISFTLNKERFFPSSAPPERKKHLAALSHPAGTHRWRED
jgi:hypothetical protein